MRGTLGQSCKPFTWSRITPAHAGNTADDSWTRKYRQDHPRPCGEHFQCVCNRYVLPGSPPPMRGTLYLRHVCIYDIRITPAHAGNTNFHCHIFRQTEDHPRPCGEHRIRYTADRADAGSPPPMRGTRPPVIAIHQANRITPAHAGNTDKCQLLTQSV